MARAKKPSAKDRDAPVTIPVARATDTFTYYANHAGVAVSPWDLTLRFGRIIPSAGVGHAPMIEEGLLVYMSPQHAKAFLMLLERQMKVFEEQHGAIAMPSPSNAGIVEG